MQIFDHGRTHASFSDPGGIVESGYQDGFFDRPCPEAPDSAALVAALERNGRMPVNDASHGVGLGQAIGGVLGAVLAIGGMIFLVSQLIGESGHPARSIIGLILACFGGIIAAAACATVIRRRKRLAALYRAWDNGWLRFAPAQVGAVWVHRSRRIKGQERSNKPGNTDVEFYFKAVVRAFPTDGTEPFIFQSEEFRAIADVDGKPRGLNSAPSPLDAIEPEFSNGWTVARYVAGFATSSATVTTNLSDAQISGMLELSDHRPHS